MPSTLRTFADVVPSTNSMRAASLPTRTRVSWSSVSTNIVLVWTS
jgi:hypothetical protein